MNSYKEMVLKFDTGKYYSDFKINTENIDIYKNLLTKVRDFLTDDKSDFYILEYRDRSDTGRI